LIIASVFLIQACNSTGGKVREYKGSLTVSATEQTMLNHLKVLSSDEFLGRKVGRPGNLLAQDYIVSKLGELGIAPLNKHFRHQFSYEKITHQVHGANIIGLVKGADNPDKFIVLSAHFDHIGKKGRKIFNGADDNASGTAALLAFAEQISHSPLKHSVILLFTDAEEINLNGAKSFVKDFPDIISRVKLNINMDMLAGDNKTKQLHYLARGVNSLIGKEASAHLTNIQSEAEIKIRKGFRTSERAAGLSRRVNWEMASDHGAFHRIGIPFIYYGVGEHKNYHQETDTYYNVNHGFFLAATKSIYQQLVFIDQHI